MVEEKVFRASNVQVKSQKGVSLFMRDQNPRDPKRQLWSHIFHVRPHSIGETRFYLWNINFWKSRSHHLFYFILKGK